MLALMVVFQHFQYLLPRPEPVLLSRAGLGMVAVAIFFVVSGFVVAEANMMFYAGRPMAFLVNRLISVVPPYMAALLLAVVSQAALWRAGRLALWDFPVIGSPLQPTLLAAGVFGLVPGFHPRMVAGQDFEFIPFAWSLRVEMAFYTATFLTLLVARRFSVQFLVPLSLLLAWLACAAFLSRLRPGVLSSGPMFLLGIATCLHLRLRDGGTKIYAIACFSLMGLGFASYGQRGSPLLWLQLLLVIVLLIALLHLVQMQACPWPKAVDRALGALSYPLYLNHYVVGIALYDLVPVRGPALYLGGVAASVAAAWAMGRVLDPALHSVRARLRGAVL
jgi:peptidoglycan/LPS O-acetylase OafA/YrhL